MGGTDYQSDFVVLFQPRPRFTVPASSLSKQLFRLEDNLIPHDEVGCPGQVSVAVFLVSSCLVLSIACPLGGDLSTVRHIVTYLGKAADGTGLQHDR